MIVSERRFDIDWLRVIAIGLLLIYHIAIAFQPWAVFIGFIKNEESLEWIWYPMSVLNVWRIPLLFFVSGMGVFFAIQRRNWKLLLLERSKRILLPFLFGMVAIVPLHILVWQVYYKQDLAYEPNRAHLWFLGNIFIYVLALSPLFFYLKKHSDDKLQQFLSRLLSNPLGLLVMMLPLVAEAVLVRPDNFELYAMTAHGFWLGLVAFFVGFMCVYSGKSFWNTVTSWRWQLLIIAIAFYTVRLVVFELNSPDYLKAIESNIWIFTVFGFGHRYLNRPSKALSYLSKAAYPVYIIHMVFLYLGSALLFELELSALVKFLLLIAFTTAGCMLTYELVIKRVKFIRPLFGLKI